jgi:hypothetical protein
VQAKGKYFVTDLFKVFYKTREEEECDNPPRKIPYYRLRPIHFGH